MNPRSFPLPIPVNPAPGGPRHRRRAWLALAATLVLAACGGGDTGTGSAVLTPDPVIAPPTAPSPAPPDAPGHASALLIPQPVSVVTTNTAGDQLDRAIGATADGGYTVLWKTDANLSMRHYDSKGLAAGPETPLQVTWVTQGFASNIRDGSVAVLEDGSVVLAYWKWNNNAGPVVSSGGASMQRFGPDGAQTMLETTVVTFYSNDPRGGINIGDVQVLAMPGGGYLVGWETHQGDPRFGELRSFSTRFFDSLNRPVGPAIELDTGDAIYQVFRIAPDGLGGYTLYWHGVRPDQRLTPTGLNVTHYDQTQSALKVLSAGPGDALLLPLRDGRYLLYTSDAAGSATREFLDSQGAPQLPVTAAPAMPALAWVLADGTYMVAWPADPGGLTVQRFDDQGTAIADVLALPADATQSRFVTALEGGGFATAWSAASPAGDLDVYTQSFLQAPTR
jgi:hypothetical protein